MSRAEVDGSRATSARLAAQARQNGFERMISHAAKKQFCLVVAGPAAAAADFQVALRPVGKPEIGAERRGVHFFLRYRCSRSSRTATRTTDAGSQAGRAGFSTATGNARATTKAKSITPSEEPRRRCPPEP